MAKKTDGTEEVQDPLTSEAAADPLEGSEARTVEAVNKDGELDDTGKPAEAGLLEGTGLGVAGDPAASQAGGPNANGVKVMSLNEATPDNKVARDMADARPELPVFDPNQLPDHENRIEVGRAQQAQLRKVHESQAVASGIEPVEVKS